MPGFRVQRTALQRCVIVPLLLATPSSAAELEAGLGAVVPSRHRPPGVDAAPVAHLGLLRTSPATSRFAAGIQLDHLGWHARLAPEVGSSAVSGVWRVAGAVRLILGGGAVKPFLAADGGVIRYRLDERVTFGDDTSSTRKRTWNTAKATAGAQAGVTGPVSTRIGWSVAVAWVGVLDEELPDFATARAGLRFRLDDGP